MNQNTLYLKYRPQTLDEIIGQEDIIKVLKKSVETGNLAHAYLFTGTRGTGKTTTARAFAKELGIHKDDITELDAASNNGVDDIEVIGQSSYSLPFFSKYKMYILDEVHMLSKAATNAFLKTLEEPPKHVIFVLCTTDPEKLLDTVLSRCVKFNLKSPTQEVLVKFLLEICKKEKVKIATDAVNLIALSGNGSFRDSLSNLQKVLASADEKLSEDYVSKTLGVAPITEIFNYLKSLDGMESLEFGIQALKKIEDGGVDNILFSKELIYFGRLILLGRHKLISAVEIKENYGEHIMEKVEEFLKNPKGKINSVALANIIDAEINSKNSSLPYLSYGLLLM